MVGWHHQFNVHELGQTLGDAEGQGSLVCCSPWGREESDMTEQLNNNKESTCQCRRHDRLRFNRWVRKRRKFPLEEEMATHSGILAWRISWIEEPGGLQSIGSQRVRYN